MLGISLLPAAIDTARLVVALAGPERLGFDAVASATLTQRCGPQPGAVAA